MTDELRDRVVEAALAWDKAMRDPNSLRAGVDGALGDAVLAYRKGLEPSSKGGWVQCPVKQAPHATQCAQELGHGGDHWFPCGATCDYAQTEHGPVRCAMQKGHPGSHHWAWTGGERPRYEAVHRDGGWAVIQNLPGNGWETLGHCSTSGYAERLAALLNREKLHE